MQSLADAQQHAVQGPSPSSSPSRKRKRAEDDAPSDVRGAHDDGETTTKRLKSNRFQVIPPCNPPALTAEDTVESEYERQRLERIRRNRAMLESLTQSARDDLVRAQADVAVQMGLAHAPPPASTALKRSAKPRPAAAAHARPEPVRRSSRHRAADDLASAEPAPATGSGADPDEHAGLVEPLEYFRARGVEPELILDGTYRGWVAEAVASEFNIAPDPATAWQSEGGGTFSFRTPTGTGIAKGVRPAGWSQAKFEASRMLRKNPNAYFYRHVAPGREHWQGDWQAWEEQLFMEIARKHGAGTKWGLFASHIPNRVGYQCSQYYRAVVLGTGRAVDPNFMVGANGEMVFVGRRAGRAHADGDE